MTQLIKKDNNLLLIRMWTGVVVIGVVAGENDDGDIFLNDPMIYNCSVTDKGINVHFEPMSVPGCAHVDKVDEIQRIKKPMIMWVDEATQQLCDLYFEKMAQMRAAKSGIVLARPNDVIRIN